MSGSPTVITGFCSSSPNLSDPDLVTSLTSPPIKNNTYISLAFDTYSSNHPHQKMAVYGRVHPFTKFKSVNAFMEPEP